jgi:hypothetical protein
VSPHLKEDNEFLGFGMNSIYNTIREGLEKPDVIYLTGGKDGFW